MRARQKFDLLKWDRKVARLWCDLAQFSVILALFVLYLAAPKTTDSTSAFNPIPWVLTAIIAVTLLRLALNIYDVAPRRLQYLWIILDFAGIYTLLVSYHLQYLQAPGISLKATTADMIFFLIAIRGILFDTRLVLAAGLVAAIGWVGLTLYTVFGPGAHGVTRSFIEYMTSDTVLIGAQVERVIAILLVAGVIALAVRHSRRDALTGLGNRAWLLNYLGARWHARPRNKRWALYAIEVRDFHALANAFGVSAAERVLREVGERLKGFADKSSVVGRFDGQIFAFFHNAVESEADAERIGQALLACATQPIEIEGRNISINACIGGALQKDDDTPESLMSDGHVAFNRAKTIAHSSFVLFRPKFRHETTERLALADELRKSLADDQLELHYQPIVGVSDGSIVGAEALLRWNSPTRGYVSPGAFIPVIEACGLIVEIGAWVVERAVQDQKRWRAAGVSPDVFVSVNVSGLQLDEWRSLERVVTEGLESGANIKLEVTESAISNDPAAAADRLNLLVSLGASLAIDDFGTGYSSYGQLHTLPFSTLKVDRSFTMKLDERPGRAVLASIKGLADGLDAGTIVEGVETEAQRRALVKLGFTLAQGFLFARPMPLGDFIKHIGEPAAAEAAADKPVRRVHSKRRRRTPAAASA